MFTLGDEALGIEHPALQAIEEKRMAHLVARARGYERHCSFPAAVVVILWPA